MRGFGGIDSDLVAIQPRAEAVHQRDDLCAARVAGLRRALEKDNCRGIVPDVIFQQTLFAQKSQVTIARMRNRQPPGSKYQPAKSAHDQFAPVVLLTVAARGATEADFGPLAGVAAGFAATTSRHWRPTAPSGGATRLAAAALRPDAALLAGEFILVGAVSAATGLE